MSKLEDLLNKFRNDESWNTLNLDGTHRFDKELEWMEQMFKDYARALEIPVDDVVDLAEKNRTYSWPNYYQPANFPGIDSGNLIGVFRTFEEFRNHSLEHWSGFKCPICGDTTSHPQLCIHRLNRDGKCDWCADGLIKSSIRVIILEYGLEAIPIFEPIEK